MRVDREGRILDRTDDAFDYIIVGAGTAGCVLANRLSADPANRVLLLEAGGKDDYIWIHIPIGYLYTQNNPRTDWCFRTEPEPGLNGRALNYPRGKVLGGCSSINGMIYMRGQAADYDHWRQLGNPGWSWDDVLPHFRKSEDHWLGADADHGAGGEWRVEAQRLSWEILDAFRAAAAEVGIPRTDDFNRGDNEGCGYFQVNQRRGIRWNTAKAFLRPAAGRSNLTIWTGAHTTALTLEGKRCTGVRLHRDGRPVEARARREVVLAAGAIGSPHLLQLSGIGDGEALRAAGIGPRHDLPGVGANLQDHLQIRLVYRVSGTRTLNERASRLWGKAWMGVQYAMARRGPLTMAPSQLGAFARSDPSFATPNLEYHVQPLSLDKFGDPLHPFPAFTASVCNLRPTSRGGVRLRGPDPMTPPAIRLGYLATEEDRRVGADAIRLTRKNASAPALARFRPEELRPGAEAQSQEDLVRAAGDLGTTIFHPVGTCRMGPATDRGAVVDAELRVHGIRGLRVADASIMPTITSGNTNAPTLMIAEKAATMILH
jgi:choline dehydrogenase